MRLGDKRTALLRARRVVRIASAELGVVWAGGDEVIENERGNILSMGDTVSHCMADRRGFIIPAEH